MTQSQEPSETVPDSGTTAEVPVEADLDFGPTVSVDLGNFDPNDSNLVQHAIRELGLINEDPGVVKGYIDMITIFASMSHSGGSASVFIPTLSSLLKFENLKPLTNDPAEWMEVGPEVWQNIRNPKAFSEDGGKTYKLLGENNLPHTAEDPPA